MIKEGLVDTKYVGNSFGSIVHSSSSYQKEAKIKVTISTPHKTLSQYRHKWKANMPKAALVEFDALINYAKNNWIRR